MYIITICLPINKSVNESVYCLISPGMTFCKLKLKWGCCTETQSTFVTAVIQIIFTFFSGDRLGHDRMIVGFTTTYAIGAYHHWCCEFESRSGRAKQHYVIKFVSDLRQVGGSVSYINKTDRHDITEILLKVVLNTIKPNQ
jgi:hypothetical protein